MATGRRKDEWGRASEIIAAIYNTIRDSKKRKEPYSGRDFNPTRVASAKRRPGIEAFGSLCGMSPLQSRRVAEKATVQEN